LEAGTKYLELGVDMMYFGEIYEENLYIQVSEKKGKKIIRISVSHVKKKLRYFIIVKQFIL
jgi:hypothetical protein